QPAICLQCQVSPRSNLSAMRPVCTIPTPSPPPYVHPFPPKVTQSTQESAEGCQISLVLDTLNQGSPTRAVFAWWGGTSPNPPKNRQRVAKLFRFLAHCLSDEGSLLNFQRSAPANIVLLGGRALLYHLFAFASTEMFTG